jgi:proline racemase
MPPSFLYRRDVALQTKTFGKIKGHIAFGGDFYLLVEAKDLGLELTPAQSWELVSAAAELRKALAQIPVQHPTLSNINQIYQIELIGQSGGEMADARNVVVCPPTVIDRSPCGTGTAARMAMLHGMGEMKVGDSLRHAGILDTVFTGKITGETRLGNTAAITCTVTGNAYLTGTFNFFLDPRDPFPNGFRLTGV